ncbi:armadillo/beta-catenin-like repeat-containing protein [Anatilimnocola floriformis]|uniref:armadillo/beta-catenin-like repeat-containing protein n=1 Tax=Anatilimnocola floriformis TaxID=2948575 RepID=UPI0020C2847C|nr:armadillo/beta-catenin-like repeat-containing protein [Anatilimnocola floriformis]
MPSRASVEAIQLVDKIWEIKDPKARLQATLLGTESENAVFRSICLSAIAWPDWNPVGIDLKGVLTPAEARLRMWEYYLHPTANWQAVSEANNLFWNSYRGIGWDTHEPRYAVLVRLTRQAARDQEPIQYNAFDAMAIAFCKYPNHARESHDHLLEILAGPPALYKAGIASRFSLLYQPFATSAETQETNRLIVGSLTKLLTDKDESTAQGAAWALGNIARSCAQLGPIPTDIERLLANKDDLNLITYVSDSLRMARRDCEKVPPRELPKNAKALAYPWSEFIDQQVVLVAHSDFKDSKLGPSVTVGGSTRLWVPDLPESLRNGRDLRLTGKLVRKFDLPRFVYQRGGAWGDGLPVMQEADLEKSRERFLLLDAKIEEIQAAR